jgi:hypothetical protein
MAGQPAQDRSDPQVAFASARTRGATWRRSPDWATNTSSTGAGGSALPLPILTYDFGAAKLNATYVPRYDDYKQFAVFGFYFSAPLAK